MSKITIYVHVEDKDWVYITRTCVWLLNVVMENYEWILILEIISVYCILKMLIYVYMVYPTVH